jgi:hypothetical protein
MRGRLVARAELGPGEREAMRRLLETHFEGVTPETFARDLDEKNWCLLLEEHGRLRGFSTLLVYPSRHGGEDIAVVYSGDTVVDRSAWGTPALARSWIGSVCGLRALYPGRRLYWLLLTSGFRTYRFLSVFWRDFHPRYDATPGPLAATRLHALARERLGPLYHAQEGVARLFGPQRLRGALADVPAARRADPNVSFFLARNPGWVRGDELVCLTEIAPENLTAAGRRMWSAGERERLAVEKGA